MSWKENMRDVTPNEVEMIKKVLQGLTKPVEKEFGVHIDILIYSCTTRCKK